MTIVRKLLNSIASDGGDITTSKKIIIIATLPSMKFDLIENSTALLPSLAEIRQVKNVAYTAAANTTYKFTIEQIVNGDPITTLVQYTSDATGADATIAAALVANFNSGKNGIKAVASGAATPISFTADAKYNTDNEIVGEPLINVVSVENVTVTDNQDNITSALQSGSITNATPRVVTAAAHGLQTGDKLIIAGVTTATDLNTTWRVTWLSSSTFSLDGSVAGGAAGVGAATGIEVAQASRGRIGDLIADGITSGDITADTAYSQIQIRYANAAEELAGSKRDVGNKTAILYVSAHGTTGSYTATSNYAAFETRITERLKGVLAEDLVLFVGYKDILVEPTGTWTETRVAQGNYTYRKTATDETCILATDITAALQTAAGKGFKLNSFDIIYGIATDALDTAATLTLDRIEYADTTAVSVNSIAVTGIPESGFQATPFVTNIVVDEPLYNVTDNSKYVIEANFDAGTNTILDWYGVMLKFTKTKVDSEVLGNL